MFFPKLRDLNNIDCSQVFRIFVQLFEILIFESSSLFEKNNINAYNFFVNARSKLKGILEDSASLNDAHMLVVYFLDNPLSEQRIPKGF